MGRPRVGQLLVALGGWLLGSYVSARLGGRGALGECFGIRCVCRERAKRMFELSACFPRQWCTHVGVLGSSLMVAVPRIYDQQR